MLWRFAAYRFYVSSSWHVSEIFRFISRLISFLIYVFIGYDWVFFWYWWLDYHAPLDTFLFWWVIDIWCYTIHLDIFLSRASLASICFLTYLSYHIIRIITIFCRWRLFNTCKFSYFIHGRSPMPMMITVDEKLYMPPFFAITLTFSPTLFLATVIRIHSFSRQRGHMIINYLWWWLIIISSLLWLYAYDISRCWISQQCRYFAVRCSDLCRDARHDDIFADLLSLWELSFISLLKAVISK